MVITASKARKYNGPQFAGTEPTEIACRANANCRQSDDRRARIPEYSRFAQIHGQLVDGCRFIRNASESDPLLLAGYSIHSHLCNRFRRQFTISQIVPASSERDEMLT